MSTTTGHHLLIVDDEEGPRQSIRMVFHKEYTVHLAENGEEALEKASQCPIDVVVLDIRMAGMNGIEVLEKLKEKDPTIEVIILTAYETLETARQALRHGARDYLGKPFDVETLRQAVSTSLMHRKVSRKIAVAEQELDRLNGELEEAVAREDMTRTLNQVYAGVLHDINNPLTIIQCFIDLLLDQLGETTELKANDLGELREKLATISRQIKVCSEIAGRHIDFLRPSDSRESYSRTNQAMNDLREMMRVHPIVKRGDITVHFLDEDRLVKINNAELTQILLNLVLNALQNAHHDTSVVIRAECFDEPLDFESRQGSGKILHADSFSNHPPIVGISVTDRAGGIPDDLLDKIFDPYFTTRQKEKGTGLGLYVVSHLVQQSGGALQIETELGKGSTFRILLPAAQKD